MKLLNKSQDNYQKIAIYLCKRYRKRLQNTMKKKVPTLKEIANQLDLSISTVSRALNDHSDVNDQTKREVKALATKLNYVPNIFAKGFRKHKTNMIGVIVPRITHYFTATIVKGILKEAESRGYEVIISESNNDVTKQTEMLKTMVQFGVDGILMSVSKMTREIETILNILKITPIVIFDKVSNKIPCTRIVTNDEEAAYNAVEHLINIGKKRIAILKETEYSYNSERRFSGYLKALKANNLAIDDKIILSCEDINLEQGKLLTNILLTQKIRPDAIFAITDNAAIGAIKTLNKFNIRIPDEIAVVGFSNSKSSTIIEPNLTTIDQPGNRIGSSAVKYLIEEIENPTENLMNKTVEIKANLLIRESTLNI